MSATSARIRTTTTCNRMTCAFERPITDVTSWDPPCCPTRPGVTSPIQTPPRDRHGRYIARKRTMDTHGHSPGVVLRSSSSASRPSSPWSTCSRRRRSCPAHRGLRRDARPRWARRQCLYHRHGRRRSRGRLPRPAYRSPARHLREPRVARDPDHAAGDAPDLTVFTPCASLQGLAWPPPSR